MAKRKKSNADDFSDKKVDLGNGLVVSLKFTVGGLLYLEDKYNKPLEKIAIEFTKGDIRDLVNLLVALAISNDPSMTVEDAENKIKQLDTNQIGKITDKLTDIFKVSLKNQKKVSGNLQES